MVRQLVLVQQIKDTLTMLCLNGLLLVPIAWPGLVLYALRWRQTRRGNQPSPVLWGFTLLHELLCLWLFASIGAGSEMAELGLFAISYVLGTVLSIGGLITVLGLATAAPSDAVTIPTPDAD